MSNPPSYLSKPWQWILQDSEIQILLYMSSPKNMYLIFKNVDISYSHLVKVLMRMEKKKLVDTRKSGRQRIVSITKKGIAVQLLLDRIGEVMK